MTAPSPEPRRVATPRWLDLRLVAGVVLVLASVVIGATVVSRARDTHGTVTATRDLASGTVLTAGDLRISQVQLPDGADSVYLDDLDSAVGKTLRRSVAGGELLPAAAVATTPAGTRLTVSLAAGAAPDLRAGQRIELWLTTPSCAFVVLLPEVTVQSVRAGDDGSFTGSGSGQSVVITIDPDLVQRVIAAQSIEDAQLRAGVLEGGQDPGSAGASPTPSGSTTEPPTAAPSGLPADLAACAAPSTAR